MKKSYLVLLSLIYIFLMVNICSAGQQNLSNVTYVDGDAGYEDDNQGSDTYILVYDNVYELRAFLELPFYTSQVFLNLYGETEPFGGTIDVYSTTSFDEDTLTWNNMPALGSKLENNISVTNAAWNNITITSPTQYIVLTANISDDIEFRSDDATSNKPYIVYTESTLNPPTNLGASTGNFYVNTTWQKDDTGGLTTDSFNISNNSVWGNGSSDEYLNNTYTPHSWQNTTIHAWNDSTSTLSSSASLNAQIPNNFPTIVSVIDDPTEYHNSSNITLSWQNSTDADNDTLTYYYRIGTSSNATNVLQDNITSNTTSEFTLTPQNNYYWSVRTYDGYNYSGFSPEEIINFTNTVPTIPTTACDYSTFHVNTTGVNFTWNASTDINGDNITYHYKVGTSSGLYDVLDGNTSSLVSTDFNATAGTDYYYSVRSNDSFDFSNWSTENSITYTNTLPTVPTTVCGYSYYDTNITDVIFSWNASTDVDADSITYHYRVGTSSESNNVLEGNTSSQISGTFNLSQYNDYYLQSRSFDTVEYSNWSTELVIEYKQWVGNSTPSRGVGYTSDVITPEVFNYSGELRLITGNNYGWNDGYKLGEISWNESSSLPSGLPSADNSMSITIFEDDSDIKAICGSPSSDFYSGQFYGRVWNGNGWDSSSIANGLENMYPHGIPEVFNYSNVLYMITGKNDGTFTGYDWNGTIWSTNSTITNGLPDIGDWSRLTVYYNGDILCMIGVARNVFYGYDWNGTSWNTNSSLVDGLSVSDSSYTVGIDVYNHSGELKCVLGTCKGRIQEYTQNGSGWTRNDSIIEGTGICNLRTEPEFFEYNNQLKLIFGSEEKNFVGYEKLDYNITGWIINESINTGIYNDGTHQTFAVWEDGGTYKMVSGNTDGDLHGNTYNGTSWNQDTSVTNGMTQQNYYSTPEVYYHESVITAILSDRSYSPTTTNFRGYDWNGTGWETNASKTSGIIDRGYPCGMHVEYLNGNYILYQGGNDGNTYSYLWNGSGWNSNDNLAAGMNDVGATAHPTIYNYNSQLYCLSGSAYGSGAGTFGFSRIGTVTPESMLTFVSLTIVPTTLYVNEEVLISAEIIGVVDQNSVRVNVQDPNNANSYLTLTHSVGDYYSAVYTASYAGTYYVTALEADGESNPYGTTKNFLASSPSSDSGGSPIVVPTIAPPPIPDYISEQIEQLSDDSFIDSLSNYLINVKNWSLDLLIIFIVLLTLEILIGANYRELSVVVLMTTITFILYTITRLDEVLEFNHILTLIAYSILTYIAFSLIQNNSIRKALRTSKSIIKSTKRMKRTMKKGE